jgi:hypothetical protein
MVRTLPSGASARGFFNKRSHALVARKVALDVGFRLGLRNAQLRGQAECGDTVDDAEVDGLGAIAGLLVHGFDGTPKTSLAVRV